MEPHPRPGGSGFGEAAPAIAAPAQEPGRFSVVVPLYNGERFLRIALDSIAAQVHAPHEVLVIDDGSQDGGAAIALSYGAPVRLISSSENGGVQAARNRGIAAATGAWIAFCDQDDCWQPDYLAKAAALIAAAPEVDFIFANFRMLRQGVIDARTKFDDAPPGWWDAAQRRHLPEGWVFDQAIAGLTFRWHPMFPSGVLARRDLVLAVGAFDTAVRGMRPEDGEFVLRCLYVARAAALPDPLVVIRRHEGNFSRDQLLCLVDEVEMLKFVLAQHPGAVPHAEVINDEIRIRRLQAIDAAFAAANHKLGRRLLADVELQSLPFKLRLKALCMTLPDALGLPLNAALQGTVRLTRRSA